MEFRLAYDVGLIQPIDGNAGALARSAPQARSSFHDVRTEVISAQILRASR